MSTDKQLYTVHRQIDREVEKINKYKNPDIQTERRRDSQTVRQPTRDRANTGVLSIDTVIPEMTSAFKHIIHCQYFIAVQLVLEVWGRG